MPLDQKPTQRLKAAVEHERIRRHARAVAGPSVCVLRGVRVLTLRRDHNLNVARGGEPLSLVVMFLTYFKQTQ